MFTYKNLVKIYIKELFQYSFNENNEGHQNFKTHLYQQNYTKVHIILCTIRTHALNKKVKVIIILRIKKL